MLLSIISSRWRGSCISAFLAEAVTKSAMIRIRHCDFEERKQIFRSHQASNAQKEPPVSNVVPLAPYSRNRCGEQSWLFYEKLSTEKLSADVLSGCQLKEKSKVYDGTHLQTIRWSSLEGCAAACAEKNACSVFYFNNFVFKRCYLYRNGEIRDTTSSVTAGFCPKGMTLEFQITFDVFQGDPIKE